METTLEMSFLKYFNLFPIISKVLAVKYKRMSYFITFIYLTALANLKLKSIKVKPIDDKNFKNLIKHNNYYFNFKGDITNCALVSIHTLIALSLTSSSWIEVSKLESEKETQEKMSNTLKIIMPPVCNNESNRKVSSYYVQCLCVSSLSEDFVLYIPDVKLFNIAKFWNKHDEYNNLMNELRIENIGIDIVPTIARSAEVSAICSAYDISIEDYEYILSQYFKKPRLLRIGDVFCFNPRKYFNVLKSNLHNIQDIYFKVIKLSGETENQMYYVFSSTTLYLNPPINSYLPPKKTLCVDSFQFGRDHTIPFWPDGLDNYHKSLRKLFQPFLKLNIVDTRPMFLLCGAKGSGKKTILKSVAAYFGLHLIYANCYDFFGLNSTLTKGKLNQLFTKARRTLPCVVFLENVELLGREKNHQDSPRLVDIFSNQVNELWAQKPPTYPVFVVGSTSVKSSDLVPTIARLFVDSIIFEALSFEECHKTLQWLVKSSNLSCSSSDLIKVAEKTKGYVLADLILLLEHAQRFQIQNGFQVQNRCRELLPSHFDQAMEIMDAAYSDSIGAARVPSVHWEDVGSLEDLKKEIMLTLNLPLKHTELFTSGLKRSGIMFYGPPGTGKTLLAKAIATECNYNFLSVKGPELMNMYVGQSEKNVRDVFERARNAAPCIIFFDELDSLAPCRGKSGDSGGVTDRVVSQLLAEMDGLDRNKEVFVLAATNRPDLVDPALLRPGRFDKMFYVGICSDKKSKLNVVKALTRRFSLNEDIDLEAIVDELPNEVTGADLYSVLYNAWFSAAKKAVNAVENSGAKIKLPLIVDSEDFHEAVSKFVPSLTMEDIENYERLKASGGR